MWLISLVYPLRWFFFFKQKTAYEMRISDWSSDVCSSDLYRMPPTEGRYGLVYTTGHEASAARFDDLVSCYLGFGRDIGDRLKALLADDPGMPMANAAKGSCFKLFGTAAMSARAVQALGDAERVLAENGATARGRLHLASSRCWFAQDHDGTTAQWGRVLRRR